MSPIERARELWDRSERWRGPTFFLGGVLLDYATLQLEDIIDQALLVAYLIGLIVLVAIAQRRERQRWLPDLLVRAEWLLPMAVQFLLGALLSALAISVLRALHPGPTALFLSVLAALAVANEARLEATRGTLSRFALVGFFSYQVLAILIPLLTGTLWGPLPALFGTMLLVGACIGLSWVYVPGREPPPATTERLPGLWLPTGSALGGVVLLLASTWLGLVPPLPLAMKRAAVAEGIEKREDGPELVEPRWTDSVVRVLLGRPTVDWAEGDEVVVYTAVHAPKGMALRLVHAWEFHDPSEGWSQTDLIDLEVRGGREGGWRTWSRKRHLQAGEWRVRVLSPYGQELGRVPFRVRTEP
ncbi:MAG: DUF2914 domain-containing protein [Deltaproteobacteria bacterium]|nr:MAG: DUF2914 domain-containing protein [Deltaproteobacteria bacterium]